MMHRGIQAVMLFAATLLLVPAAEALNSRQRSKLEEVQNAYATAVRWGEFESAWQLVDPAYRAERPMTELDFGRYEQVQVSGYRELNASADADGTLVRNIELRVINRHTMAERTVRYRERWRWDAADKRWWLVEGLPDLWQGR
jgi:hypothetical protein